MWQRWNQTTHIFEKSIDNGGSWTPLGLSADIITEGVLARARHDAQTAYKDATNVFTPVQFVSAGIQFPNPQNPQADNNTLDDYVETTWTPGFGGSGGESGQVYTLQHGTAVKIGRLVIASFSVSVSNKGTITGSFEITGLPFLSVNLANSFFCGMGQWNNLATNWVNVWGLVLPNTTRVRLRGATAAAPGNATDLVTADVSNTTGIVMTIMYIADE